MTHRIPQPPGPKRVITPPANASRATNVIIYKERRSFTKTYLSCYHGYTGTCMQQFRGVNACELLKPHNKKLQTWTRSRERPVTFWRITFWRYTHQRAKPRAMCPNHNHYMTLDHRRCDTNTSLRVIVSLH